MVLNDKLAVNFQDTIDVDSIVSYFFDEEKI